MLQNGRYLDSCIVLGSNSSYSASEDGKVFLEGEDERDDNRSSGENADSRPSSNDTTGRSSETIIEIQVKYILNWKHSAIFFCEW